MGLREHLFDLVSLAPGDVLPLGGATPGEARGDRAIPGGATLRAASAELGLRLTFDVHGEPVHVEIALLEAGRRHAVRTKRLGLAYRSCEGEAEVDPALGLALCRAVAERAALREDEVLATIAREAAEARRADHGSTRVREVRAGRLLEPSGTAAAPYHTLSPYVGCLIGCRFCYAQSRLVDVRRLELLPEVPWGSWVDARVDAPDVLRRELAELPPWPIKLCPIVSDPYQAVEDRYRLTRRCLEVLRDAGAARAVLVLTRSARIARDADVLAAIPGARAGCSVPTADDAVARHFEPRASPIAERLAALASLRAAGVPTFAVVQPLLPGSIAALADALASAVESVSIDVLRGVEGAGREFSDSRYAHAARDAWQRERALELATELRARGVAVWGGELPPDLVSPARPS